jgi:hypothetical protein
MGISSAIPNLVSFISGILLPAICNSLNIGYAFATGAGVCLVSLVQALFLIYIDNKATRNDIKLK